MIKDYLGRLFSKGMKLCPVLADFDRGVIRSGIMMVLIPSSIGARFLKIDT